MKLRAPEPSDTNLIYIWDNSTDEAHTSLRTGPLSRCQIESWIKTYDGDIFNMGGIRYMIDDEESGHTVGTVDVFDFDRHSRHAFVGIYISPQYRRRGYGRKALDEVGRLMRQNVNMYSLQALVAVDNAASKALFESAGYAFIAVLPGWLADGSERLDAVLYQRVLAH